MPQEVNGTVYVPAVAFCQSAGVSVEKTENGVAITRAATAPAAQAAPTPTAEPEHPEYVAVDLTTSNFGKYFSYNISVENFKHWDETYKGGGNYIVFQHWSCDYRLRATALTPYKFENVRFTVKNPGIKANAKYDVKGVTFSNLTMPQSGEMTRTESYKGTYISMYTIINSADDVLYDANDLHSAFFEKGHTSVSSASGKVYIPWEDAQAALESKYQSAQKAMEDGNYQSAVNTYKELAENQYKDAAQQLLVAEEKLAAKKEAEKKAKEEADLNKYNEAQALLNEGSFDEAEKAFADLKNFKDSAAKVEEVKTARLEARYQDALKVLQAEDWDKAIELFTALGYKDSAAKAEEAREGKRAASYNEAVGYVQQKRYDKAIGIFRSLGDYKDSAEQMAACQLELNKIAYAEAEALEKQGKSLEAYNAFAALGNYKDSAQRAAGLKYYSAMNEAPSLMAKGDFRAVMSSLSPYIDSDPEAYKMYWQSAFHANGVAQPMSADGTGWVRVGSGYTLMDIQGKVITHVDYTNPGPWQNGYSLFKKKNGRFVYLDTQGREAFGMEFKEAEDFNQGGALVTLADGAKAVATDDGLVFTLPEKKGREYKSYVGEDLISFVEKDKWGLVNLKGKVVAKAKYTHGIDRFKNGMAKAYIKKKGEYYVPVPALLNAKGKEAVKSFTYNNVIALGDNLIAGKNMNTDNYRIMTLKGKTLKNSRKGGYKNVDAQGGVILAQLDNKKWLALDLNLNPIINAESTAQIQVGAGGKVLLINNSLYLAATQTRLSYSGGKENVKMSPDSPYVLVKNGQAGWCVYDGDGKLIF